MCGCSGTPTVSQMTVEQLQEAQAQRQRDADEARRQYAESMRAAMQNAGAAPEMIDA